MGIQFWSLESLESKGSGEVPVVTAQRWESPCCVCISSACTARSGQRYGVRDWGSGIGRAVRVPLESMLEISSCHRCLGVKTRAGRCEMLGQMSRASISASRQLAGS